MDGAGAGEILLTSMDRDGTQAGYDLPLTRAVADAVGIPVIASGGVGTLEHLYDGLVAGEADAVLAASIFHYGSTRSASARSTCTRAASRCDSESMSARRSAARPGGCNASRTPWRAPARRASRPRIFHSSRHLPVCYRT